MFLSFLKSSVWNYVFPRTFQSNYILFPCSTLVEQGYHLFNSHYLKPLWQPSVSYSEKHFQYQDLNHLFSPKHLFYTGRKIARTAFSEIRRTRRFRSAYVQDRFVCIEAITSVSDPAYGSSVEPLDNTTRCIMKLGKRIFFSAYRRGSRPPGFLTFLVSKVTLEITALSAREGW